MNYDQSGICSCSFDVQYLNFGSYSYFVYYGCGLRPCSLLDKYLINKTKNKIQKQRVQRLSNEPVGKLKTIILFAYLGSLSKITQG